MVGMPASQSWEAEVGGAFAWMDTHTHVHLRTHAHILDMISD